MGVSPERHAEGSCQTEVGEFEVAVFIDEEVLGFQVAVENAVGVAVADAGEELGGEFLDLDHASWLVDVYVLGVCW